MRGLRPGGGAAKTDHLTRLPSLPDPERSVTLHDLQNTPMLSLGGQVLSDGHLQEAISFKVVEELLDHFESF